MATLRALADLTSRCLLLGSAKCCEENKARCRVREGWGAVLHSQGRLPEMIFKQRKENEGGSHVNVNYLYILEKVSRYRGNDRCKGPEVGIVLGVFEERQGGWCGWRELVSRDSQERLAGKERFILICQRGKPGTWGKAGLT